MHIGIMMVMVVGVANVSTISYFTGARGTHG